MITIKSNGRMGNKLHYFIFGIYLHELTGMEFVSERIDGFVNTYTKKNGTINTNQVHTSTFNMYDQNVIENIVNSGSGIIVDTMIPRYNIMKDMDIKKYLQIENENGYDIPGMDDLVIHIRLGDYVSLDCVTSKKLYMDIIDKEKNSKCIIVTDDPTNVYFDDFLKIGCKIRSESCLSDFVYIKNANKICISKSTYSWTAAYISDAEKIYFPITDNKWPYYNEPGYNETDMRPLDKKNWIFV